MKIRTFSATYMLNRLRKYLIRRNQPVEVENTMRLEPVSRTFGVERGMPIDRYYIESFLQKNSSLIQGDAAEIAEDTYIQKYGQHLRSATILSYDKDIPNTRFADLTRCETLPEAQFDCLVLTQTLNFIRDPVAAVAGAARLLRPGGVLIGTVAALSQLSRYDSSRWGDFWRFTDRGTEQLLKTSFAQVSAVSFGNFAVVRWALDGLAVEDLPKGAPLHETDPEYPLVVGFIARK